MKEREDFLAAFVLKNSQSSQLLQAIRNALRGVSFVAPEIRKAMSEVFIWDPKALHRPQHLTNVGWVNVVVHHDNILAKISAGGALRSERHYL